MTGTTKRILCTGGAGYIGIHTAVHLVKAGYEPVLLDNLSNASEEAVRRLNAIVGREVPLLIVDVCDYNALEKVFREQKFDAVIHYAALKAVGESCEKPLEYYDNNTCGIINLLKVMRLHNVKEFVFSSSATVYKESKELLAEEAAVGAVNPYGHTKVFAEQILSDLYASDKSWRISVLRYFNPVGNHESGTIGESPDYPLNLLPYIQQVAVGRREHLSIFGNDWPTKDGTGVRDYIHVEDLAEGHIAALKKLSEKPDGIYLFHNLGTGVGVSVLELVQSFEKATGQKIPYKFTERRAGDVAMAVANPAKANKELNWKAKRTIEDACSSAWKWQSANPNGYP